LSRYENSKRTANIDFAKILAEFFSVSVSYILGTSDDREIDELKGERLPPDLKGIVDAVGVLRGTGLSNEDIKEILIAQAELQLRLRMKN
jgi:transcriptional regulator with XRE-family HTH domain